MFGGILSLSVCFTSFAGWRSDGNGWWFDNGNGTWPASCWLWVDGNQDGQAECYYFQQNGYILTNASTPDGYTVDGNGAWVVNGVVQRRATGGGSNSARIDSNKGADVSSQIASEERETVALYNMEPVQSRYLYTRDGAKTVQGKLLSNVFQVDVNAYGEFYAGGKYRTLTMMVAPKAGFYEGCSCMIQVVGDDGVILNESDEINYRTNTFKFETDISGQEFVRFNILGESYGADILIDDATFSR